MAVGLSPTCDNYFPTQAWSFGGNINGPCSGNGLCLVPTGLCQCEDGWTGLADFVDSEGYDCGINILATQILWGIVLAFSVISFVLAFPYLKARHLSYLAIKEAKAKRGESYPLIKNPGSLTNIVWFGIGLPSLVIFSILKIARPEERIGITLGVSICYFLVRIAFYVCALLFQPSLLAAVVAGADASKTGWIVKLNLNLTKALLGFHVIAAVLPFFSIYFKERRMGIFLFSLALMAFTAAFIFVQAWYIQKKLTQCLDQSYKMSPSEKTLVMKAKLREAQKLPLKTMPIFVIAYLTMFIWPFMWTKHDYFFPVTMIAFIVQGLKVAKTSITSKEESSIANKSSGKSSSGDDSNTNPSDNALRPGFDSEGVVSFVQQKEGFEREDSIVDSQDDSYV